jgi:hypothetical protein
MEPIGVYQGMEIGLDELDMFQSSTLQSFD